MMDAGASFRDMVSRHPADRASDLHATTYPSDSFLAHLIQAVERAERLNAVTAALSEALAPADVVDVILHEGIAALGAVAGGVLELSDDRSEYVLLHAVGYDAALVSRYQRVPADAPLPAGDMVRSGAAVFVESAAQWDARYAPAMRLAQGTNARAWASLPLIGGGSVLGALTLTFDTARVFTDNDRTFMTTLAHQCGQALERARLYEAERRARAAAEAAITEMRRSAEGTRILADASAQLAASLDVETTLGNIAQLAVPALADWCAVHLAESGGKLRLIELAHVDTAKVVLARELVARYPLDLDRLVGIPRVVRTGRALLQSHIPIGRLAAAAEGGEHLAILRALGLRSSIIVPLISRGETLGAITFASAESGRRFDRHDLALAEELGRRAGLAMDNARLYAEARQARLGAEEASRAKNDFLAVMSHELRTPLTAVVGYAELLADEIVGPMNELQHDHLERIRTSGEHLMALIEDVLNFSKIEARQETLHVTCSDLGKLVGEVAAMVTPLLAKRGLTLRSRLPDAVIPLETDCAKVRQILINLISNAIKFTERGGIELVARVAHGLVTVDVTDTGVGIREEHLAQVFEPFWQADQKMTRRTGGTGLGLSVALRLAQLLGGELTAASTAGVGSTFTVTFPVRLDSVQGGVRAPL